MATAKKATTKTAAAKKATTAAKKATTAKKPAAAKKTEEKTLDIAAQVETVVKKLSSDSGLLEKFKTNAMAVVKKLLPAIKDKNILQSIISAVSAKLNLGSLLGGLTGKKDDKKEGAGGILSAVSSLLGGK